MRTVFITVAWSAYLLLLGFVWLFYARNEEGP